MTQNGVIITPEQEAAILEAMVGVFTFNDVRAAATRAGIGAFGMGVRYASPSRVADRLLQRERRAGRVRFLGQREGWVKIEKP
ncbi:MAG TPA: hypothetical protein VEC57_00305 [Candidatus Limnocylindrales bacterium]|nr:hypothetical protein [Candidatus Limnocylindrales bacterium]